MLRGPTLDRSLVENEESGECERRIAVSVGSSYKSIRKRSMRASRITLPDGSFVETIRIQKSVGGGISAWLVRCFSRTLQGKVLETKALYRVRPVSYTHLTLPTIYSV